MTRAQSIGSCTVREAQGGPRAGMHPGSYCTRYSPWQSPECSRHAQALIHLPKAVRRGDNAYRFTSLSSTKSLTRSLLSAPASTQLELNLKGRAASCHRHVSRGLEREKEDDRVRKRRSTFFISLLRSRRVFPFIDASLTFHRRHNGLSSSRDKNPRLMSRFPHPPLYFSTSPNTSYQP